MPLDCLTLPQTDPTSIFESFRGSYSTELLVAAVAHFDLFGKLGGGTVSFEEMRGRIGLAERPANVLLTALCAMGLLARDAGGRYSKSALAAEHLTPGGAFEVTDYIGLAAQSPGVVEMVERLRSNRPAGAAKEDKGAAFIFREGLESAMDSEASARRLTLALAGRAKNVAPALAQNFPLENARTILDVGGGTGIYSIALLQKHPALNAIVLDRAEVLKVAAEMGAAYGVADRLKLVPGDMFTAKFPADADVILLSNILHDWDLPECQKLVDRCAAALPKGGRLVIHDVFLNDDLCGPLPLALYSAALFTLTEGRAYSAGEYRQMYQSAALVAEPVISTLIHCGLLTGRKAS